VSDTLRSMRGNRPALFKGRHFEGDIIVLCVRWYLRFGLSFRNLEEMMAERNLNVDHVTIWRWVQRYAPELNRRCRRELRMTNRSWRADETYLRVAGKWTYLYRAVDSTGTTIDFLLSARRDAAAAKRFFQKGLRSPDHPRPRVINVDGNPSYPKVIAELKKSGEFVLPGFAKFIVVKKPATPERSGINPFTKEPTVFKAKPARKILKVRPVKAAKDAV